MPALLLAERLGLMLFAMFIFFACFTFLKPSPYAFLAIPTFLLWMFLDIRLHRVALVFLIPLLLPTLGLVISLSPHLDAPLSVEWTIQSIYLMITACFFTM